MRPFICLFAALLLSACTPYRPPVQQGNQLRAEQLATLEAGMNKREVLRLLGHPLLQDPFNADRWDYYYSLHAANAPEQARVISLWFAGDALQRFEDRALQGTRPPLE